MTEATFVLSTGRCGTQWLAAALARAAGDAATVTHEPLDHDYSPRLMWGAGDPAALPEELAEPILAHAEFIEETLAERSYIECGHTSWSTIPWFLRRFQGRVRIIHLVRHPVPTALSWVSQQAHCPPAAPHLSEKVLLTPLDGGVQFPSWSEAWPRLAPYEKVLHYWSVVNALGLELEETASVPWLRIRFEDLFRADVFACITSFAGLDDASGSIPLDDVQVDEFRFVATSWSDPSLIERHPDVMAVARRIGYEPFAFDAEALRQRYRKR